MNIQKCEVCNKNFVAGYGYSIAANWLVTGSAYVSAYMCSEVPGGQHWGCCPEHAMQALMNCLSNHMHVQNLMQKHKDKHTISQQDGTTVTIPRYSQEDASWADQRYKEKGEDFHIVNIDI